MGLTQLLIVVIITTMIFLTVVITRHIAHMEDNAKEKSGNEFIFTYMKICEDMIKKIVFETDGTFVDELKKNDKFDAIAKKKAFNKTKNRFITIMGDDAKYIINSTVADFDEWIKIQIEAVVAQR